MRDHTTFTVAQYAEHHWVVLDGHGEERHTAATLQGALTWAGVYTSQANQALADALRGYADALAGEAVHMVGESYRRGQADAFFLAHLKLSFLLGGTLPRGGRVFRQELDKIATWLVESNNAHRAQADESKAKSEERLAPFRRAIEDAS